MGETSRLLRMHCLTPDRFEQLQLLTFKVSDAINWLLYDLFLLIRGFVKAAQP